MSRAQSGLILFPRFTTFVGAGDFATAALDVSAFGSAQIEFWRGPFIAADDAKFRLYMEESLDGVAWYPLPANARGHDPGEGKSVVLSQSFAMKWFRLRAQISDIGSERAAVTCWAEGILRA
jgi:hypothetical protein